jgi:hypothetical protein
MTWRNIKWPQVSSRLIPNHPVIKEVLPKNDRMTRIHIQNANDLNQLWYKTNIFKCIFIHKMTTQIKFLKNYKFWEDRRLLRGYYFCRKAAWGSEVDWFDSDWPSWSYFITRKGNFSQFWSNNYHTESSLGMANLMIRNEIQRWDLINDIDYKLR